MLSEILIGLKSLTLGSTPADIVHRQSKKSDFGLQRAIFSSKALIKWLLLYYDRSNSMLTLGFEPQTSYRLGSCLTYYATRIINVCLG